MARYRNGANDDDSIRLFADGFDRCGHAAFATCDKFIFAERMNLVPLQLRMLKRRGQADRFAAVVDFLGNLESGFDRKTKNTFHHQHDVFVAVVRIVPQHNAVTRLLLCFGFRATVDLQHLMVVNWCSSESLFYKVEF